MASWRISIPGERSSLEAGLPEDGANVGLITRFGSGFSVLTALDGALDRPAGAGRARARMRLGELLVAEGMLTEDELAGALAEQRKTRPKKPLGEILLRRELIPGAVLVRFLTKQCERELDEEGGFGSGLRRAIEDRHRAERATTAPALAPSAAPEIAGARPVGAVPPSPEKRRRLGELLVESGLLTGAQLDEALAEQEDSGRLLGEILLDRRWVPTITLVNVLAEQLHGQVELADGFGTGLRDAVEDRLLERLPEQHEVAAA
ncbi:MAG TPA: hypothetical protein VF101_03525 [Gaiellaceae bacterium]